MPQYSADRRRFMTSALAGGLGFAATFPNRAAAGPPTTVPKFNETSSIAAAKRGPAVLLAGTARVDITPAVPSPYDLGVSELADKVAQRLYARLVYLERGDHRMLLVAVDSEGVLRTAYNMLRAAIAASTGLEQGQIIINASHTHSGLYYSLDDEVLLAKYKYHLLRQQSFNLLVSHVAEGARQAAKNQQPVALSVGQGGLPELAWNRRLQYLSDYHARRFNPRRKFPIGTTDPTLGIVRLDTASGKPLALLCNYACHATIGETGLSGDWPGYAMLALERELGDSCTALFVQGCAGNVAPNWRLQGAGQSRSAVDTVGALFAARAQHVLLTSMEPIDAASLTIGRAEYPLPLVPLSYGGTAVGDVPLKRWFEPPPLVATSSVGSIEDLERRFEREATSSKWKGEDYGHWVLLALADRLALARNLPEWNRHEVHGIACGPLCFMFLPGEVFVDYALEIKESSSYKYTFVSAYNDSTITYVPDPVAFEEGGYETGPWCYSTPETGGVIVSQALRLMSALKTGAG